MTWVRMTGLGLVALVVVSGAAVLAQDAAPGGGRRGAGGRPGMGMMGGGMMGGPMMMLGGGAEETVAALADLNLAPDFSLNKEQKEKIAAIRADFKKAVEAYRTEHKDEIAKAGEAMRAAREAQDREKMRDAMTKVRELREGAPKEEDVAAKIKEVLTPEQRTQLEAKLKEREEERQKRMEEMRAMMGGPGGGRPAAR